MATSSSLCVKLWKIILRYTIGVEDFLDPDTLDGVVLRYLIAEKITPSCDRETIY